MIKPSTTLKMLDNLKVVYGSETQNTAARADARKLHVVLPLAQEAVRILRDLTDYWDNGNPVHAGAEIVEEVEAFLGKVGERM